MEMTTYQAVFAVLLIFFLGDLVGALTKVKISSMFVIMMGFLVLFMTGIYPDNVMEISGFAGVASLGQYFLLFNMGTSVDIPTLKCEWRTVLCATVGMAAAILGCAVVIPLIGKEYSMAAAPVVNGGIVAPPLWCRPARTWAWTLPLPWPPLSTPCRSSWALCPLPTAV